jgi:para-aminobenzoate synthetase component 1
MTIQVNDLRVFKQKALQWASSFDAACYLDSNNFKDSYSKFDALIAFGAKDEITAYSGF